MYTNENNKFSFRDVILQFLFVALFIFILLWLFPSKDYMNDFKSELLDSVEQSESGDQQSTLITSAIFNQNITTMKEAAILYFTTPRLPEHKGDVVKLTLKDMLNEHLLVAPLDEQGKVCDTEKSYVEITKLNDEYTLKVNLKCGSEEEYIIVHLGCYDYCQGTVCESKTTPVQSSSNSLAYQYQYKLNGKWTNWSSWSKWQLNKVTSSSTTDVEYKDVTTDDKTETIDAKEDVTYTCPEGYTLSGTKCIKASGEITKAIKVTKYTCDEGYVLSNKQCVRTVTSVKNASRKVSYTCPSGYTLSGTSCISSTTTRVTATKTTTYVCPTGYSLNGTTCIRSVKTVTRMTYTSARSGAGYSIVSTDTKLVCNDECRTVTYYTYDVTSTSTQTASASVSVKYSCPSGYSLSGTTCYKTSETITARTATTTGYVCESGYTLNGTKCYKTTSSTLAPHVNISYTCPSGTLVESSCTTGTITTTIDATKHVNYSCQDGYKLSDKTCTKTVSGTTVRYYRYRTRTYIAGDIQWRDTKTDSTLLKKGYYLTGNKRVKSIK